MTPDHVISLKLPEILGDFAHRIGLAITRQESTQARNTYAKEIYYRDPTADSYPAYRDMSKVQYFKFVDKMRYDSIGRYGVIPSPRVRRYWRDMAGDVTYDADLPAQTYDGHKEFLMLEQFIYAPAVEVVYDTTEHLIRPEHQPTGVGRRPSKLEYRQLREEILDRVRGERLERESLERIEQEQRDIRLNRRVPEDDETGSSGLEVDSMNMEQDDQHDPNFAPTPPGSEQDFRLGQGEPAPDEATEMEQDDHDDPNSASPSVFMIYMCSNAHVGPTKVSVLLDSGAAVSLTPDRSQFHGTLKPTPVSAMVANGSKVRFGGVGQAFGLQTVYYMPEAKATLISMADLVEEHEISTLDGGKTMLFLNKNDGTESWRFVSKNGLYMLAPADLAVYSVFTQGAHPGAKAMVLHRRLGHASWRQIQAMVKNQCVTGLERFSAKDLPKMTPHCHGCALGKIRRSSFAKVNPYRSKVPGAGWHVDIISVRIPAIENQGKYFLLFTDDATRTWVGYLMTAKSEATRKLEQFHTDVIKFYSLPMVFLKSDRGGEFTASSFRDTLMRLGIRQILVTPRDPQLNGSAERQGQTLFGDVRAMLIDGGMPMAFWAYACRYSVFIRNRLPRLRSKEGPYSHTPIEWLTGKKPSVERMKIFGAHCTYYHDGPNKHKLLPRGRAARFIGLAEERYYMLWDSENQRIVTRTHVQFRERGPSSLMAEEFDIPADMDNAQADQPIDGYSDCEVGVPVSVASDLVNEWNDDGIKDPYAGPPTKAEQAALEARAKMAAVPTREFSRKDRHLQHPAESPLMEWEEITAQLPGTEDQYVGPMDTDRDFEGIDDSDDDGECIPVEDMPVAYDPSNAAGHLHPLMLKSLKSQLRPSALAPKEKKRSAPRSVTYNPGDAVAPPPAPAVKDRARSKSPPVTERRGRPPGSGKHQKAAAKAAARAEALGLPPPQPEEPKTPRPRGRPKGSGHRQRAAQTLARRQMPHEDISIHHVDVLKLDEGVRSVSDRSQLLDLEGIFDRQVGCTSYPVCITVMSVTPVVRDETGKVSVDKSLLMPPLHYRQAHKRTDSADWSVAEEKEMAGLRAKNVFTWVRVQDLPPGTKVLTTRYVYDFKTNEFNEIIKYKARLVVRGFEQRAGIEFNETFSATIRASSVRTLLAVAAHHNLKLRQLDVEQAFLTAGMDGEVIYVRPPGGQEKPGQVWLLNKALYGLKQASNLFEKHFADIMVNKMGMRRVAKDRALYVPNVDLKKKPLELATGVYVDDCITAYANEDVMENFKKELFSHITMVDVGPLRYCLGMHIVQDPVTYNISVSQRGFVEDLLTRTGHMNEGEGTRATPTLQALKLSPADSPTTNAEIAEMNRAPYNTYRSIVGSLMYLTGATRPDIGFAVNMLARYVANPGKPHWRALVHLLRYLRGTMDEGVHYCGNKMQGFIQLRFRRGGGHCLLSLYAPRYRSTIQKHNPSGYRPSGCHIISPIRICICNQVVTEGFR
jgi:transposase InsO family protein